MTAEGLREKAREWLDEHVPLQFAGSSTEPVGVTHIDKESMSDLMAEFAQEQRIVALEEAERAVCINCRATEVRGNDGTLSVALAVNGKHIISGIGAEDENVSWDVRCDASAIASLRSELGSGPEGEER